MFLEYSSYSLILIFFIILTFTFKLDYLTKLTNLYDLPDKRKIHSYKISRIGGLILFTSFLVGIYFNYLLVQKFDYGLLIFASFFFIIGLIDDIINIKSIYRILLVISFVFFFTLLKNDVLIESIIFLNQQYYFDEFSNLITVTCVLLLYISLNMLDGIDGIILVNFVLWIVFLNYFYEISSQSNILQISLVFASLILLFLNLKKKLFIGNSGTSLISSILCYFFIQNNYFEPKNSIVTISVLIIPGIDMIRLFIFRLKNNLNPFTPDKKHFHHILYFKYNLKFTLLIYSCLIFMPFLISDLLNFKIEILTFISIVIYAYLVSTIKNAEN